jgi:hypothetical protein
MSGCCCYCKDGHFVVVVVAVVVEPFYTISPQKYRHNGSITGLLLLMLLRYDIVYAYTSLLLLLVLLLMMCCIHNRNTIRVRSARVNAEWGHSAELRGMINPRARARDPFGA